MLYLPLLQSSDLSWIWRLKKNLSNSLNKAECWPFPYKKAHNEHLFSLCLADFSPIHIISLVKSQILNAKVILSKIKQNTWTNSSPDKCFYSLPTGEYICFSHYCVTYNIDFFTVHMLCHNNSFSSLTDDALQYLFLHWQQIKLF